MSRLLWKYYFEDDLDSFQQLLGSANFSGNNTRPAYTTTNSSTVGSSPGRGSPGKSLLATSPVLKNKLKNRASATVTLTRADLNWRDNYGRTLLHHMATSSEPRAAGFALALLKVPLLDLYVQDLENGWTSLHRALYYGNITIARALMARDIEDATGTAAGTHAGGLIKIKDKDGNSPFDVYNDTISARILERDEEQATISAGEAFPEDASDSDEEYGRGSIRDTHNVEDVNGDEIYMFGTNKNYNLGFADGDDRQFPEQPPLQRPSSLLKKHYREHIGSMSENATIRMQDADLNDAATVPAIVRSKALRIHDVRLAKLHSAILTTDAQSNLYVCGFGPGYRLGTGDDQTRFSFTSITGGGLASKKIVSVALGQNHTVVITSEGETYTWGSNVHGQLGYTLAKESSKEEDQVQPLPRQIFGPLKREFVIGCAASKTHTVVHTRNSLFTFGKNDGQLGLVDADARALELQMTPRQVALSRFSSQILMVSAIDTATICLLDNHDVLVFANYGYSKLQLPLDGFASAFSQGRFFGAHRSSNSNHVIKVCSGGSTICCLTSEGEVLTVSLKSEPSPHAISTTNPSKIRDSVSAAQKLWSIRKTSMAARDVDVGQDGSVIICTAEGSVWRREKRAKIKDAASGHVRDYKFSRVPGLTRIAAVRSNAFGAAAAIRRDHDVLKKQLIVESPKLWKDIFSLLPLRAFVKEENSDTEEPEPRFWRAKSDPCDPATIRTAIVRSKDLEKDLATAMRNLGSFDDSTYDLKIGTTLSETRIPIHSFLLTARSSVMRTALSAFAQDYYYSISEILTVEYDKDGHPTVVFQGLDVLSLLVLVFYLYTDYIIDVWHIKNAPSLAYAYRQARSELMKLAGMLDLKELERATRLMVEPDKVLRKDLDRAIADPAFLDSGDIEIQLDGDTRIVHSTFICQRCPFFEGLFFGRTGGGWLAQRRQESEDTNQRITIDLADIQPAVFDVVLRYLYADTDDALFEDIVTTDLDAFLDFVLDVAAAADELMLDRLAQICQRVIGGYVTTRNVCNLLNAIAPFSVTDFKDVALEYICLNLEGMLENGLLEELDAELMVELDAMVQDNQLSAMPFVRSGRAEAELLDTCPELAEKLDRARQILIDSVGFTARRHEDEAREERLARANAAKSPLLLARAQSSDLLFDMDEDGAAVSLLGKSPKSPGLGPRRLSSYDDSQPNSPQLRPLVSERPPLTPTTGSFLDKSPAATTPTNVPIPTRSPATPGVPWGTPTLSTSKLDMKQIMAQTSESHKSGIAAGLAGSAGSYSAAPMIKMSQKERKRQQIQQREQIQAAPSSSGSSKQSPWRTVSSGSKVALHDVVAAQKTLQPPTAALRRSSSPGLTMRQTIPGNAQKPTSTISSPSVTPQPRRTGSGPVTIQPSNPTTPHSVRHNSPSSFIEPTLQLSMGDILAQQSREKELLKEAVAKRSLLEIQEEQAFADWWEKESAATKARMEEEEQEIAQATSKSSNAAKTRGHGSRRGGRRGGKAGKIDEGAKQKATADSGDIAVKDGDAAKPSRGDHAGRGRSRSGARGGRRGGAANPTATSAAPATAASSAV